MHEQPRYNVPPPYRGPVDRAPVEPSGPGPWNVLTRALIEGAAIGAFVFAVIRALRGC